MKTIKQWVEESLTLSQNEKDYIFWQTALSPNFISNVQKGSFKEALQGLFIWDDAIGGHDFWMNKVSKEESAELSLYELSTE